MISSPPFSCQHISTNYLRATRPLESTVCKTAESDIRLVRDALKTMGLPNVGTVWIGPYEQLHGAGFALLAAARHGVHQRDLSNYHLRVRTNIVQIILEHDELGKVADRFAFDNAMAGFYFNSAIQRIVWASERLIKTFVSVPCLATASLRRITIHIIFPNCSAPLKNGYSISFRRIRGILQTSLRCSINSLPGSISANLLTTNRSR